ncbi:Hypothetical molybdenum cofactor biosynthesis protein MoaC2 [Mycobacteroides abscessus]|nr:Hypothetical molybdenum cofactor biosynthesis protein MoaC2 [Mycobacteroides abscessus]
MTSCSSRSSTATAVTVAGLTLHDMVKAVDPASRIDDVRVLRKEGGKTGTWTRP